MYEDMIYILLYEKEKTSANVKPIIINQDENSRRPTISDIISSQTNVINILLLDFLDYFSEGLKYRLSKEYEELIRLSKEDEELTLSTVDKYKEYENLTSVIATTVADISQYACLEIKLILLKANSILDKDVVELIEGNTNRINHCKVLLIKNPISIEELLTKMLSLKKSISNDMYLLRLELRKSVYNEWVYNEVINRYFAKFSNIWNDQLYKKEELVGARYKETKTHTYWEMMINLFLANDMNYDSTQIMIDDDSD